MFSSVEAGKDTHSSTLRGIETYRPPTGKVQELCQQKHIPSWVAGCQSQPPPPHFHFRSQRAPLVTGRNWWALDRLGEQERTPRATVTMTTGSPAPACSILLASPRPAWVAQGPGSVWPVEGILTIHCPRSGLLTEAEETEPCPCPYLSTGPRGAKGEAAGKH